MPKPTIPFTGDEVPQYKSFGGRPRPNDPNPITMYQEENRPERTRRVNSHIGVAAVERLAADGKKVGDRSLTSAANGRLGGRPPNTPWPKQAEIREKAREYANLALENLVLIASGGVGGVAGQSNVMARVRACEVLLDRGFGKVPIMPTPVRENTSATRIQVVFGDGDKPKTTIEERVVERASDDPEPHDDYALIDSEAIDG